MAKRTTLALVVVVEQAPSKPRCQDVEPRPIRKAFAAVFQLPQLMGGSR